MITRTMKHLPGGIALWPLKLAMTLFVAASMCLAAPPAAQADVKVTIKAPRQEVVIGESTVGFEAQMEFCTVHHRGSGFVEFAPRGGDSVRLYPFWGSVDRKTGAVVLFLSPRGDGPLGPREIITLVVQDSATEDCDIWDLLGPEVVGPSALHGRFEAETRTTRSIVRGDCDPIDFGQIDAPVSIRAPIQRVEPPPAPSEITGFGAKLFLDRDQQARGSLSVFTARERRTYEAFFGAAFRTAGGEVEVFVFSLLDTRRGFLSPNDHAMRATGGTTTTDPDCLIWDLINGTTGQVNGVFDAEGTLRVWLPPRDR